MFELSQTFYFEAAHTLIREIEAEASRRIHGHTYTAEVTVRSEHTQEPGMVVDLGVVRQAIARVRDKLDHHFLDEVPGLGPATLENLCLYIHAQLKDELPGISAVSVSRQASGDRCVYTPSTALRPPPQGGNASGPAEPDPRRSLDLHSRPRK